MAGGGVVMPEVTNRPFSELFGGRPGDGSLASLTRAAARAGYAVLPIAPGEKRPLCVLTERQRQQADKKAAQEAKDAGKRNWERVRHGCGIDHATLDEKEAHRWFKRLADEHPGLNLAVDVYRSRALVVDADTAAELASFTTLWARREGEEELIHAAPTVRSPGDRDEHGVWRHSEGGHYWFLLPEAVELGDLAGVTSIPVGTDPDHLAQLKVSGYVLVPPSVRAEGEYRMASDAHIAPAWLVKLVVEHIAGRREVRAERRDRALDADDHIRLAQSAIAWAAILAPRGWVDSGKSSRCGCPEWTAPGDHASTKSATAHDPGCAEFDTADGFIHIWTDNPPGSLATSGAKTFSKIQFVAWHDHDGDNVEAMTELGVLERAPAVRDLQQVAELLAENEADDEQETEDAETDPVDALLAELIPASRLDEIPPPVPLVDGLLDCNSLARVIGKSGHGKSFFMIDVAGHVALGRPWHGRTCVQGDVVYMVAEGAAGINKRVRAWERHHKVELGERVKFLPRPVQVKDLEWLTWIAAMAKLKPSLIIIDTQARVTAGANENGPEDMGQLVQRADLLRQKTGACVVLVHHKGHQGDHGRGHSMVIAAMDAEIEVAKEGRNKVAVMSSKQKDQEDFDPIRLELVKVSLGAAVKGSAVLVASGTPGPGPFAEQDPLVDEMSPARDRLVKWIYEIFRDGRGGTKSEILAVVKERDRGPTGKPMARSQFNREWGILEKAKILVPQGGSRVKVTIDEARRLGLEKDV